MKRKQLVALAVKELRKRGKRKLASAVTRYLAKAVDEGAWSSAAKSVLKNLKQKFGKASPPIIEPFTLGKKFNNVVGTFSTSGFGPVQDTQKLLTTWAKNNGLEVKKGKPGQYAKHNQYRLVFKNNPDQMILMDYGKGPAGSGKGYIWSVAVVFVGV